uniref:Transmembrane protein 135 N-terminal domain-containing protein n=1 Tax=Hyaloperonospora arabidopsidis (strain Emoy2) TaxID=559515 RepID=M4BT15_HYAAE
MTSSTASNLHVTASDISLFSRSDGEGDAAPLGDEQLAARTLASEQNEAADQDATLGQELLAALQLGMSNFLLAYNTRAGIATLLRLFKLLQRREWKAALDLRQLLDERQVRFRVDAVQLGLFLGWFTGGYRAIRTLLVVGLRRYLSQKQCQGGTMVNEMAALGSGAIAALALGFVDAKRRRSMALYALTRALQCGYNTAKRLQHWHFWGSDWPYGDALLFALSSAQVMYAYVMRPKTLPSAYFWFIQRTGPVEMETLELVQQVNRRIPVNTATLQQLLDRKPNISRDFPVPMQIVPCRFVHSEANSCVLGAMLCFKRVLQKTFPLYLSLFIVPGVVIHFKRFLRAPFRTLARSTLNATRSNCFLASFVTLYLSLVCVHRRVVSTDHRFVYYLAGLLASTTILLEPKSRRSGFKYSEVALFSVSMSVIMYCYEHEKDSLSPFLYNTMKRFMQTSTDKKRLYVASLEKKERRQSLSLARTPTASNSA